MSEHYCCSGYWPRSLGEHHHNAHDLTEYLRRDERRLLGIESERAGRRFHWSWTESGSAGFSITHEQSVWAVMHVGTRFVSKGWVTCRRVETINPRLSQPDVDFFWGCIRSLPVGDVELPHWGWRDLGRMERQMIEGYNRQYNATVRLIFDEQSRRDAGQSMDAHEAHNRAVQRLHSQAQRLMTEAAFSLAVAAGTANNASWTAASGAGEFAARHGARLPTGR